MPQSAAGGGGAFSGCGVGGAQCTRRSCRGYTELLLSSDCFAEDAGGVSRHSREPGSGPTVFFWLGGRRM